MGGGGNVLPDPDAGPDSGTPELPGRVGMGGVDGGGGPDGLVSSPLVSG